MSIHAASLALALVTHTVFFHLLMPPRLKLVVDSTKRQARCGTEPAQQSSALSPLSFNSIYICQHRLQKGCVDTGQPPLMVQHLFSLELLACEDGAIAVLFSFQLLGNAQLNHPQA